MGSYENLQKFRIFIYKLHLIHYNYFMRGVCSAISLSEVIL